MKKLVAENSFWELFPDAAIGILAVRDMRPAADVPPEDGAPSCGAPQAAFCHWF